MDILSTDALVTIMYGLIGATGLWAVTRGSVPALVSKWLVFIPVVTIAFVLGLCLFVVTGMKYG